MRDHNIATTLKSGISFGSALAMVISYANWHSVGWAAIHGLMGWLYVGYYILKYYNSKPAATERGGQGYAENRVFPAGCFHLRICLDHAV